ncbi:MAG: transcription termination/antitermination factor NusG [Deltaproteobacteria bacterium]|nr:MAG: transcription termination/antitermination factor NusG [Deltaproteobacteria bacterium]
MQWYVVHTFSGYENSVKKNLELALKNSPIADQFGEILVPMEEVTERRGKTTRRTKRKSFPGYIFVQMVMTKASWHMVSNTPRVTGFLGGRNPRPVRAAEMQRMLGQGESEGEAAAPEVAYKVGDKVRVKSGAFANFVGEVEEVNADKRKIWLSVSIFGRPTRVEVDFSEVEPAAG